MDTLVFTFVKGCDNIGLTKEAVDSIINSYYDELDYSEDLDSGFENDDLEEQYYKDEQKKNDDYDNGLKEWIGVAKNFVNCIYRGYRMFQTINLSKKIIKENKYRKQLDIISKKFNDYQNNKRLYEDDPIKNINIINESIDEIEKIRDELLQLMENLKKEIDKNINHKKSIIGNIIYQIFKLGKNIYEFHTTKNPIMLLNIGLDITSIVFCGIDYSYTNDIIDEIIKVLKDAKIKQKEIENEIESLNKKFSDMKKVYPTYFK